MQKIEKYLDNITNKMAKNNQEVVFDGWLTKSPPTLPPTKRIWRARWRRRWFCLTQGELPGQYVLNYFTDRNCRHLKGVINLDHCEQVDLGLKLEKRKLKFDHVFDIKTPTRTYYLAADTEAEMTSWVKCICKVCGLRSTNDDDDSRISGNISNLPSDIEVVEEESGSKNTQTPPISPVSTSPYIPISECMTGKYPVFDRHDMNTLKSNYWQNDMYDTGPSQKIYLNYVNDLQMQMFYDSPRKHEPKTIPNVRKIDLNHDEQTDNSPLQSPTDSENVFTEEDWVEKTENGPRVKRPSAGSIDSDLIATQKFTKTDAPPRPPKPVNISQQQNSPNYLNLTLPTSDSNNDNNDKEPFNDTQKVITDEMYDFPRSHQMESNDSLKFSLNRRHCYNNAAPAKLDGQIFKYDISPKPSTSQVFRYDSEDTQEEPASPHSQTSSTPAYSNLPSPLLTDNQLMPPPMVNRELKPKRKLSDSLSISSINEPPSPRGAPSVDRKLKPPTPLQEAHMRRNINQDQDERKVRAAPSPLPLSRGHSHENLPSPFETDYLVSKMQYLDLDLDCKIPSTSNIIKSNESSTVYKKVDFMKTQAFNITKKDLENRRQDPVAFLKK